MLLQGKMIDCLTDGDLLNGPQWVDRQRNKSEHYHWHDHNLTMSQSVLVNCPGDEAVLASGMTPSVENDEMMNHTENYYVAEV